MLFKNIIVHFKMFQIYNSRTNHFVELVENADFLNALKTKWDDLHQKTDIFRYQIDTLNERMIDNHYLIQLNPNRGIKRRIPEKISCINQSFDDEKFNFTKVSEKEKMFTLIKDNDESDKHVILVNVSPINYYHSLLCPSMYKRLPQVITMESMKLVLEIMSHIKDRSLKIGFNSLCALASVNHLHYHLLFESRILPVEIAKCKQIKGTLYSLEDYVVPTLCFYVYQDINLAARDIFKLLHCMLVKNIAHNILMTWGTGNNSEQDIIKVFIWPRKSCAGVKNLAAFNVAVCELSGWFPVYDPSEFANIQREDLENEVMKWKYEEFDDLCAELKSLF